MSYRHHFNKLRIPVQITGLISIEIMVVTLATNPQRSIQQHGIPETTMQILGASRTIPEPNFMLQIGIVAFSSLYLADVLLSLMYQAVKHHRTDKEQEENKEKASRLPNLGVELP